MIPTILMLDARVVNVASKIKPPVMMNQTGFFRSGSLSKSSYPRRRSSFIRCSCAQGGRDRSPADAPYRTSPSSSCRVRSRILPTPCSQSVFLAACPGSGKTRALTYKFALNQIEILVDDGLMDLNRPLEAADAFQAALGSSAQATREDAAYGQSLAYLRLGLTDKAAVAATKAPQSMQRSSELQVAILANRANLAFDAGRYREALIYLDQRALLQPETTDLLVLRGYAFINLNRAGDAMRIFEAVAETGNRDAARGLRDARVALGLETTD